MDLYNSYGVRIDATLIGGITSQSIALGSEHAAEPTAGAYKPQSAEITSISPRGNFSSYDIAALLGAIGTEGLCLTGGAVPGFGLWQLKREACGSLAAGTVHRLVTIPNGRVIPRTLSVGHRQNAECSAEVIALFDDTNDPVLVPALAAAPTGLDDTSRWTLGAVSVGGTALEGNTSVEINFGVDVQADGGDSDLYDTHLQLLSVKPEITITTRDVTKFPTIPLKGVHGAHADTSIVLRKRTNATGDFSTGADSIKITADGLVSVDQAHSSQANQRGEMTIKITALDDGTNDPLVLDFAYTVV